MTSTEPTNTPISLPQYQDRGTFIDWFSTQTPPSFIWLQCQTFPPILSPSTSQIQCQLTFGRLELILHHSSVLLSHSTLPPDYSI